MPDLCLTRIATTSLPWLLTLVSSEQRPAARISEGLKERARDLAIPILIGVVAYFIVAGWNPLDVRSIAWLSSRDSDEATYFLGWHFFRHSPWGFPLGVNPRYGAEIAASLAYVDNGPGFAFFFKALRHWLPDPMQYFGIWFLLCFTLQAWFAWLLVGLLTQARFSRALGTIFFVFAPPFLWRLGGHYQMVGHWLILAALYLSFGPRRLKHGYAWPVLAVAASLVHTYITAMILALWLCDVARRWLFEGGPKLADFLQLLLVPGLVGISFWQSGIFLVGKGITKEGFGIYRFNLTSLFDASGWSYLLKDIPESDGDYEGFAYLGLGGLLLLLLALPTLRTAFRTFRARKQYWLLFALLLGLTLFAISYNIGFGPWDLELPLSKQWIERANVLRSSGRMIWPAFYVLVWLLLRAVLRFYPARIAAGMLFVAVLVQAIDTSAGWLPIRRALAVSGREWNTRLHSPFWALVPSNYSEIRIAPPENHLKGYEHFAYFASMHRMATDAVYLARVDESKVRRARNEAIRALKRRRYRPGVLYIVDRAHVRMAREGRNPERDLFDRIDGYWVLAPDFLCRPECHSNPAAMYCSSSCEAE